MGRFSRKSNFPKHDKKHAQFMLANTLGDGGWLNCGHRLREQVQPLKETKMADDRAFNIYLIVVFVITMIVLFSVAVAQSLV